MPLPTGGAGGGAAGGPSFSDANTKRLKDQIDATEDLVDAQEKLVKSTGFMSAEYVKNTAELAKSKKQLEDLKKELADYTKTTERATKKADEFTKGLVSATSKAKDWASTLKSNISEYHAYNLAIQNSIDQTGRFVGQSAKARQEFDSFRRSLNLTRKDAIEFSDAWVQGMRLGATNNELKQMVGNLQKIHGQMQGLKMARDVLAIPMGRETFAGVRRGDVGSAVQAMRMGNMQQMQAVASMMKTPGGRTPQTEAAIRFERTSARIAKTMDDLKAGMQGFAAVGIGPEMGALLTPVTDIAANVAKLVEHSGFMRQLAMRGATGGIPGAGGLLKTLLGGLGGGSFGGIGARALGGRMLGGGLFAAGGMALGAGLEGAAQYGAEGGMGGKLLRTGAMTARGAGIGAGIGHMIMPGWGTAIGGAVGGIGGAAVGGVQQFGGDIAKSQFGQKMSKIADDFGKRVVSYGTAFGKAIAGWADKMGKKLEPVFDAIGDWTSRWADEFGKDMDWFLGGVDSLVEKITGVKPAEEREKVDFGDLLKSQGTLTKTIQEDMATLGPTIEKLPESIRAGLAEHAAEIGIRTRGREDITGAREAFDKQIVAALGQMGKKTETQRKDLATAEQNVATAKTALEARRKTGKITPEEEKKAGEQIKGLEDIAQDARNSMEVAFQDEFKKLDLGRGARVEMQRGEFQRGQVGLEREAAAGRFRRTGAITGDIKEITKFREAIDKGYAAEADLLATSRKEVNAAYKTQEDVLKADRDAHKDDKEFVAQANLQLRNLEALREADNRILDNQEQVLKLNQMEAEVANERAKVTAYELTATFRRAQAGKTLARAQEEFARERGGTPAEVGGFARQAASQSQQMLDEFNKTFAQSIESLTKQAGAARAGGDEARAVLLEKEVYDLRQKGVELERTAYQDRVHGAVAAAQLAGEQAGVQKSMLEVMRDTAARTGQSWRVQMGYQAQIIQASRVELQSARAAFAAAKEAGESGLPLMQKQLSVIQKESALREAIMGKQRDFLEKAVAAGFGMGGGTKAQPNINPRIFGEIVKDVTGMTWQGAPKTMMESRMAMGGNIRGAVGMGGGGIGIGPGGRPGVNPAAAQAEAQALAAGATPEAAKAAGMKAAGATDISGQIAITVKADAGDLKLTMTDISKQVFMRSNMPGNIT